MSNRLELPSDLISLIEKRELDDRREIARREAEAIAQRAEERRTGQDRRQEPRRAADSGDRSSEGV